MQNQNEHIIGKAVPIGNISNKIFPVYQIVINKNKLSEFNLKDTETNSSHVISTNEEDDLLLKELEALTERVEKIAKDEKRLFGNVRQETSIEIARLKHEIDKVQRNY